MGMFDKPQYLTGDNGAFNTGDTFWLHNARVDGTVQINGEPRDQCKLLVSRERDGETFAVYSSGRGIVNQVRRMDASDRNAMPLEVRLDEAPAKVAGRNPTNVLTPANAPAPAELEAAQDEIPF